MQIPKVTLAERNAAYPKTAIRAMHDIEFNKEAEFWCVDGRPLVWFPMWECAEYWDGEFVRALGTDVSLLGVRDKHQVTPEQWAAMVARWHPDPPIGESRSEPEIAHVLRAAAFAADRHRHQRRKGADASPYVNHPLALARLLAECSVLDPTVITAALLHDTVEDTGTSLAEIAGRFGEDVAKIVAEVSDDKRLPKAERKRLQIEHAPRLSHRARLVKLADKICNLRDLAASPPVDWSLPRRQEYFDWAQEVVDQIRGTHAQVERLFDEAYAMRPVDEPRPKSPFRATRGPARRSRRRRRAGSP